MDGPIVLVELSQQPREQQAPPQTRVEDPPLLRRAAFDLHAFELLGPCRLRLLKQGVERLVLHFAKTVQPRLLVVDEARRQLHPHRRTARVELDEHRLVVQPLDTLHVAIQTKNVSAGEAFNESHAVACNALEFAWPTSPYDAVLRRQAQQQLALGVVRILQLKHAASPRRGQAAFDVPRQLSAPGTGWVD